MIIFRRHPERSGFLDFARMTASSQFLRESLKLVTLDHVADLIFAEVAKLYSALEAERTSFTSSWNRRSVEIPPS